jgi:hypothetical protein
VSFEERYFLGEDTELYNRRSGKKLKKVKDSDGYVRYSLYFGHGVKKHRHLHSIVAEKYYGPRPPGMVVNHIDGDKLNNKPENLEYVTPVRNTRHAVEKGLIPSGFDTGRAAVSVETILTLYTLYLSGKKIPEHYSLRMGVSRMGVFRYCRGNTHKQLWGKFFTLGVKEQLDKKRGLVRDSLTPSQVASIYPTEFCSGAGVQQMSKKQEKRIRKIYGEVFFYDNFRHFTL